MPLEIIDIPSNLPIGRSHAARHFHAARLTRAALYYLLLSIERLVEPRKKNGACEKFERFMGFMENYRILQNEKNKKFFILNSLYAFCSLKKRILNAPINSIYRGSIAASPIRN